MLSASEDTNKMTWPYPLEQIPVGSFLYYRNSLSYNEKVLEEITVM